MVEILNWYFLAHLYSKTDIMITPKGKIFATVDFFSGADAGFFVSDDGDEWTNITAAGLSIFFGRTVMAFDPSDEHSVLAYGNRKQVSILLLATFLKKAQL